MPSQQPYLLTQSDLNNLKQCLSRYVQLFYSSDPIIQQAIVLKKDHSLRVCKEILNIGRELDLSHNNLRLAEAMALFHDIGRFEQFTRYEPSWTKKSENHGELGVKVLQREKTLAALNEDTRELILKAIAYHNRLNVSEEESPVCLYFSKLLREAHLFADQKLLKDMNGAEKELSAISDLSSGALSFLIGLSQLASETNSYWNRVKGLVQKDVDPREKSYLSASIYNLRSQAERFNGRFAVFKEMTQKGTAEVKSLVVYDELAAEIGTMK